MACLFINCQSCELKGQILGVLLVLMVFGGLVASYQAIFNSANSAITERASETITKTSTSK